MKRKKIYFFTLVSFFVMWGVFGVVAAAPRGEAAVQSTTSAVADTTVRAEQAGIPVTGEPAPVWTEILGFYGLIGLAAMCLVLALLNFAGKSSMPHPPRKGSSSGKSGKS